MKNISIFMSFVAVLTASMVLGLAVYHNKGQILKTQDEKPEKTNNIVFPVGSAQSGHVITEDTNKFMVEPTVEPTVIEAPIVKSVQENPVQVPNDPIISQPPDILYTADSSIKFAMGDLLTIPEEERKYIRYISLYNIPKIKRKEYAAVLSFVVNSLSTRKKIYIPEFVGASDETLIRLNINHYEWPANAWEQLGLKGSGIKPNPEPYFHYIVDKPIIEKVKIKRTIKEKVPWRDEWGRHYQYTDGTFAYKEVEKEITVEESVANKREYCPEKAPWLDPIANNGLCTATCSSFPIYRLDWFVSNVIVPPAYFNFLRLGDKAADFEKLIFADEALAKKARSQDKGIVVASMVARNNRTLTRSPTFTGGYYWVSHDALKSINDRDYVKILLDENFDATEDIGSLPNGLQAYFLTDGKGKRLDFANPDIAIDHTSNDKLVRTGRSCIVCHSDGIRPIGDEVRSLTRKLKDPKQVQLLITRKEDAYRIEDLFSSDLDEQIIKDQNYYRAAVAKATGLQSETVAKSLNEIYNFYIERLLTVEDISREIGINVNDLNVYIEASKDNVVLGLLKTPTRPIRRDQWELAYGRFVILVNARKQGLDHADPYPPGPLIDLPKPK